MQNAENTTVAGKWIETGYVYCGATVYKCPVCGEEISEMPTVMGVPKYNGCPYCLSRLEGVSRTGR